LSRFPSAAPARAGGKTRRIGFVLLPSFSYLGLAAAIEPLFIANWLAQRRLYSWQTLALDGTSVEASSGLRLRADGAIAGAQAFDAVFLLASFEPKRHAAHRGLRAWIQRQARHGVVLGGIETGGEVLAAALTDVELGGAAVVGRQLAEIHARYVCAVAAPDATALAASRLNPAARPS